MRRRINAEFLCVVTVAPKARHYASIKEALHSTLNAEDGSIRIARRAGRKLASAAMPSNTSAAVAHAIASATPMP